jgi:hypothetical protein
MGERSDAIRHRRKTIIAEICCGKPMATFYFETERIPVICASPIIFLYTGSFCSKVN